MKLKFSVDRRNIKNGLIVSVMVFIICVIGMISYKVNVANFVEVSAKIVDVSVRYSNRTSNNQSRNKYVIYKYELNNKEYIGERLSLFATKNSIGNTTNIRVNPNDPVEIQNNLIFTIYFIGIIISGGMIVPAYQHLKKSDRNL